MPAKHVRENMARASRLAGSPIYDGFYHFDTSLAADHVKQVWEATRRLPRTWRRRDALTEGV